MPSSTNAMRRARPAGVPGPLQMFFQGFLKHPVMVGSIIPSSDRLIRKMLAPVDWANCKQFAAYLIVGVLDPTVSRGLNFRGEDL